MANIKRLATQSQGPVRPAADTRARKDTHDTYAYVRTKRIQGKIIQLFNYLPRISAELLELQTQPLDYAHPCLTNLAAK